MNKESANIALFLSSAYAGSDNVYTIKNFKLQETLGEMYYKYKKFKLVVNAYMDNTSYTARYIKIVGLDWCELPSNQLYPNIMFSHRGGLCIMPSNFGPVFNRPSNSLINLRISFNAVQDVAYFVGIGYLLLTIYGVEENKISIPKPLNTVSTNFYLYSSDATLNVNNAGSSLNFDNVRIREILGGMYDKYNKFKLILTSFSNVNTNSLSDTLVGVKIKGLNFIQTYDYAKFSVSPYIDAPTLAVCTCGSSSAVMQQTQCNWGVMFNKPSSNNASLILYLYTIQNNAIFTNRNYGISTFYFTIYGIN